MLISDHNINNVSVYFETPAWYTTIQIIVEHLWYFYFNLQNDISIANTSLEYSNKYIVICVRKLLVLLISVNN